MKKVILLACLILGFTFLNAQLINSYGIKAGLCVANQDFDYTDNKFNLDTQNWYGLNIGAFIELFNKSNLNLLIESHYAPKGNKIEVDRIDQFGQSIGTITYNSRVDYLEFDILGKYTINLSSLKPYFFGGPKFDILLDYDSEKHMLDLIYKKLEPVDFGLSIGCGTELKLFQNITTLIEFRYSPTLTSSYKTEKLKVRNSSFEFLTGIKF